MPKTTPNTATKTAMSIRNAYAHLDPTGLFAAGGIGAVFGDNGAGEGTGWSGFCESQFASGRIKIKNLGIAPPLDGCFQLALRFVFTEVLVEQILEKFCR
jgi:hypothetical protein